MAKRLSQLLPEHKCYVEIFSGAANLLKQYNLLQEKLRELGAVAHLLVIK